MRVFVDTADSDQITDVMSNAFDLNLSSVFGTTGTARQFVSVSSHHLRSMPMWTKGIE